jgi:hypothetical protein
MKAKKSIPLTAKDVLAFTKSAMESKPYPASELANIIYDMDYAQIGKLIADLREFYEGKSFRFEVDGDNCLEEICIQIVFECIESMVIPYDFYTMNETTVVKQRIQLSKDLTTEDIEQRLNEWSKKITKSEWWDSESWTTSYCRIFPDNAED